MDDVSVDDCSHLIGQYEATDQGKVEGLMSIDGKGAEAGRLGGKFFQGPLTLHSSQGSQVSCWAQRTTCLTSFIVRFIKIWPSLSPSITSPLLITRRNTHTHTHTVTLTHTLTLTVGASCYL